MNEKAVIRKLGAGIDALQRALPDLELTDAESASIHRILERHERLRDGLSRQMQARAQEESRRLQRMENLRRQRQKQAIEEVHRRSGFTDRVVLIPGSFEGGRA